MQALRDWLDRHPLADWPHTRRVLRRLSCPWCHGTGERVAKYRIPHAEMTPAQRAEVAVFGGWIAVGYRVPCDHTRAGGWLERRPEPPA